MPTAIAVGRPRREPNKARRVPRCPIAHSPHPQRLAPRRTWPGADCHDFVSDLRIGLNRARICRLKAMASAVKRPSLRAFLLPRGAPLPTVPPCTYLEFSRGWAAIGKGSRSGFSLGIDEFASSCGPGRT